MALPRVVVFGEGPLPVERLPLSGTAWRSWHIVQALLAAGHDVCFVAARPAAVYPPDLPPVLTQTKDRLAYYSVAAAIAPAALDRLVPGYGGACVVSVGAKAAALADALVGYLPHWADLYGGVPAPGAPSTLARAFHADIFSCVDESDQSALLAALAARGRQGARAAGHSFARIIPVAGGDLTENDAFALLAAEMLAWASLPLHAPDWVAPATVPGPPPTPIPPASLSRRAARTLWRLSKRATAVVGLAPAQDRLAAAIKARLRQR